MVEQLAVLGVLLVPLIAAVIVWSLGPDRGPAIRAVSDKTEPVVFALWGAYAQKKEKLVDTTRHRVLKAAHPSPLSARHT